MLIFQIREVQYIVCGKIILKKNHSSKAGQLYQQLFILFLETEFETKLKRAKPFVII